MKIEGVCSHCERLVSVLVHMPTTWGAIELALMEAHSSVSWKCGDDWFLDGLYAAAVTSTAPNPHVCRHADTGCECYSRCPCGWLVPVGALCSNPHHESESKKRSEGAP